MYKVLVLYSDQSQEVECYKELYKHYAKYERIKIFNNTSYTKATDLINSIKNINLIIVLNTPYIKHNTVQMDYDVLMKYTAISTTDIYTTLFVEDNMSELRSILLSKIQFMKDIPCNSYNSTCDIIDYIEQQYDIHALSQKLCHICSITFSSEGKYKILMKLLRYKDNYDKVKNYMLFHPYSDLFILNHTSESNILLFSSVINNEYQKITGLDTGVKLAWY